MNLRCRHDIKKALKECGFFIILFLSGCVSVNLLNIEALKAYKNAGCCAEIINEDAICYHCQNEVDRNIFLRWNNSWED